MVIEKCEGIIHNNCNLLSNKEAEKIIHVVKYQNGETQSIAKRASFLHWLWKLYHSIVT